MIIKQKDLTQPDQEAKVWRFLDFTKFVDLVDKEGLWFSRLDKLGDPFEGKLTRLTGYVDGVEPKQSKEYDDHIIKPFREIYDKMRKIYFVSCWHLNEYESAAMWNLYIKSNCGIAIQSSVKKLEESLNDYKERNIFSGKVEYIDYSSAKIPINFFFKVAFYKHLSYKHENEVRFLIDRPQNQYDPLKASKFTGFLVPVDLNALIEKVYVAPHLDKWKYKLVKNLLSKYCLNKPVCQSTLDEVPY